MESTSETDWANNVALNLATIIQFAFDEEPKTAARLTQLREINEKLAAAVPPSFQPFHESAVSAEGEELTFPRVWIASSFGSEHIPPVEASSLLTMFLLGFTVQHLILCQLILVCYDTTSLRIGLGSYNATQQSSMKAVTLLRRLCGIGWCGIGMSQASFGPCMILSCIGASICGDRVVDERVRKGLVEVLIRTEEEHAYPTTAIRQGLLKAWAAE